jgi:hypothetical protein
MPTPRIVTVVETPEFINRAGKLMTNDEREELIDYLARNPDAGDLIVGAGGVRKLRWKLQGRGKRGGARVIYFFANVNFPLFALGIYAKNEQKDLTSEGRKEFRLVAKALIETYPGKK